MTSAELTPRGARGRKQLPEEVAAYVRELIMSGKVRPGEFLRMEPIAEAVGVSNTPVREGLLLLNSEGFVQLVPRRGFVVASFTPQDVRDIFWAQAQLAAELAARAAKNITPEQIAKLESIDEEFDRAVATGDHDRIAAMGNAFHVTLNRVADSHRLALLLQSVVSQLPSDFYATIEGQVAASENQHREIVDALKRRQIRRVRSLMTDHITGSADHLVEMLESRGLWAPEQSA